MRPLPRLLVSWLLVMAVAAAVLAALDRVPTLLAGTPRGVRAYASIEDAERAVGARIWMPGYYPDELGWPPARVDVAPGTPPAVAVRVAGRGAEGERLAIVETLSPETRPPASLLPEGERLGTNAVIVGRHAAILARVLLGTREWHDLSWTQAGRGITLRYSGPVDRLLLIGGSLARRADEAAHQ
jgi:hypothetical protein